MDYPILEFDSAATALIEPSHLLKPIDLPERCVLCFFQDVIAQRVEQDGALPVSYLNSEVGKVPIYKLNINGEWITLVHPGVGSPFAAVTLEELIALGCRKFIACGGAGVLDSEIVLGHVIVPTAAVRDEGTSYHYAPPSREIAADPQVIAIIEQVLTEKNIPYLTGKTWTTDAIYRETLGKIARRKAEGCLTVEMETATFLAVAQFRNVKFGQLLYGGDDVSRDTWDSRGWQKHSSAREQLFSLAIDICLNL